MHDDGDMALCAPEVILPAQLSWGARHDGSTSGVLALMIAILEDATLCIEKGRRRHQWRARRLAAEAREWVCSDCHSWLFSFASICDVLGLDAEALRVRLLTDAARPACGERAARVEADAPSARTVAVVYPHMLPQRERGRRSVAAVADARVAPQLTQSARRTAAGFNGGALAGVA